ncbi:MAG: HU family DNA-binding protein [Rhodobacteraceae bacterium]|nr:HU family DNA-binding protein [Paracoccaceae bacterium]
MNKGVFVKQDLINIIHEKHGLSKSDCRRLVDRIFDEIISSIATQESVKLTAFGTFKVIRKKGRTIKDINTGELLTLPSKYTIKFIPSEQLKEKINE